MNFLITGGSKGIGLACARAALAQGAQVAIVSRTQSNLDTAKAELGANLITLCADMSDPDAARRVASEAQEALGNIDALINSAGAARRYDPYSLNHAAWTQAMQAKFFSTTNAIDAVIPMMAARGRGRIVNIIGMGGKSAGVFHIAGGAANAALMLATTGLAAAYAAKGLRINAINPGITLTGRVEEGTRVEAQASGLTPQEVMARATAKIPMGRAANPEEIAAVALFLVSDAASYVNGAIIPMDGVAAPII